MNHKALVSARPWSVEDSRTRMIASASAADGLIGGRAVRVVPEPMVQGSGPGEARRSVRIVVAGLGDDLVLKDDDVVVTSPTGTAVPAEAVAAPGGATRILVPLNTEPQDVFVSIPELGPEQLSVTLDVPREWKIHVVHHSHLDIGYTDPQRRVLAEQRSFLDSALDLVRATKDWPDESRFRWAVEGLYAFRQWARLRPQRMVDEFVGYVRDGLIELSAMPYSLHTDTCSTDELHELLRPARQIRDRYGLEFPIAMQTDVPGQVVGLPEAMGEVGVKYLSVAHNWAGRSMPHTNGGQHLPRLFRWTSPSGHSVLVWMTDSPHGMAYMEGPVLGLHQSYAQVDDLLPAYLTSLAKNSYPFPPGMMGWHGDPVDRAPYPWDVLHLRTQGMFGDNAPARLAAAKNIREWNETWTWPKLVSSTNERFFVDAEQRLGDQIQTFEGDWGDWWVEGVGSAAAPQAGVRKAQVEVNDGQTLAGVARLLGGATMEDAPGDAEKSYEAIALFDEHTWGGSNSWRAGDEGFDSGEQQWQWKAAHSLFAQERATELSEYASAVLGSALPAVKDALCSYYVFNTAGHRRSAVARIFVRESVGPLDVPVEVRDGRDGSVLAAVEEAQQNETHREAGRFLNVSVPDVPSFGYVRVDLMEDGAHSAAARTAEASAARPLTIENEHLRVTVDDRRACVASIVDLHTGHELVNSDAVAGFNAYIYDTYTTAGGYNHQSNKMSVSDNLELLGSRTLAHPAAIIDHVDDGVEQRLSYQFAADGVDWIRVTLTLRRGEPQLLIENRMAKPSTMTKESAFFAFPFQVSDPEVRYEITGGLTGDGFEQIPGAPQHMRAIRGFASLSDEDRSIAWATADAPLVHPEVIALPYAPFPDSTTPREPGTIYSWVHNNVWDTNFPVQQAFVTSFRYAVGVSGAGDSASSAALGIRTATAVAQPLRAVLATGEGDLPAAAELLRVSDDRVKILSAMPPDGEPDRLLVRLQSLADQDLRVTVTPGFDVTGARTSTYLGDPQDELLVSGSGVELDIPALSHPAVLFDL